MAPEMFPHGPEGCTNTCPTGHTQRSYTAFYITRGPEDTLPDSPDDGYLDSWPKTVFPPPPWKRLPAQFMPPRRSLTRQRSRLSSTTLSRIRGTASPRSRTL